MATQNRMLKPSILHIDDTPSHIATLLAAQTNDQARYALAERIIMELIKKNKEQQDLLETNTMSKQTCSKTMRNHSKSNKTCSRNEKLLKEQTDLLETNDKLLKEQTDLFKKQDNERKDLINERKDLLENNDKLLHQQEDLLHERE